MDVWQTILVGILSSMFASVLFLTCLFRLQPKIGISPLIGISREHDKGKIYKFKIINYTRRPIINVRFSLSTSCPVNVPDGVIVSSKSIRLEKDYVFQIPKFSKRDKDAQYARRIKCREDLDAIWKDQNGNTLKFIVMATDSLSGFSKVFTREFHTKKNTLVEGNHRFGNSLDVL